jgi:glycosyltransferase involved in cell wall biosynthesis
MKKILFISDYLIAGGAENVLNITIDILKDKYDIALFYGSKEKKLPNNPFSYIYSLKFKYKLMNKLLDYKPDIIILFNYYHLLSPSILSAIRKYKEQNKVKVIMSVHDFHILAPNSGFYYYKWFSKKLITLNKNPSLKDLILYKWDERGVIYSYLKVLQWIFNYKILKLQNVIDIFISPSEFLGFFLKKEFKNVHIIRNPLFKNNTSMKQKWHLKNTSKTIKLVYFGRISYEKGLYEFLMKMRNVKIDYTFTIIGNGNKDYISKLKNFIKQNSLEQKIKFLGYKPYNELLKSIYNYDIFVLPSILCENAPLSLIEASISGLKLLTMNYGGMKEIAQICGNYYLLDKNYDVKNLENALINLTKEQFILNNKIKELFSYTNYQKILLN